MGNPYRKVAPGEPLRIPAAVYNAILDLIARPDGDLRHALAGHSVIARAKNNSQTDLPRFGIAQVSQSLATSKIGDWELTWANVSLLYCYPYNTQP